MLTKQQIQNNVAANFKYMEFDFKKNLPPPSMTEDLFEFANAQCPKCKKHGLFRIRDLLSCEKCGYYKVIGGCHIYNKTL